MKSLYAEDEISMSKALFWDFDGTLIHPNESFLCALNATLSEVGRTLSPDKLRAFLQTACSWYLPEKTYPDRTGQAWWDSLFAKFHTFYAAQDLSPQQYSELDARFKTQILDPVNYTLYDDTKTTLEHCAALGYTNYILSNNYPELPATVRALGLDGYFAEIFVSSHLGYEKPHPAFFRHALQTAGTPAICYMIGDNPIADIQGAMSAGMTAILVHREGKFETDYHCRTLSEIPPLLR